MARNILLPLKNVAKTIRNVGSKLAPRDTGNLRNALRAYNTPERMIKQKKGMDAVVTFFVAPPQAKYGKFWNDPFGRRKNSTKQKKSGGYKLSIPYILKRKYPQHFNYGDKAFQSKEYEKAVDTYVKQIGTLIIDDIRETIRREIGAKK